MQSCGTDMLLYVLQELAQSEARAQQGLARVGDSSKTSAYQAWLGFYNSFKKPLRWTPEQLVQHANQFSQTIGELPFRPCVCQPYCLACTMQHDPGPAY